MGRSSEAVGVQAGSNNLMVRTSDRIVILGLSVIGISIIGLFALLQHHERHPDEQAWSSRQQASVVTGAVGSSALRASAGPAIGDSEKREDIDASKLGTIEATSSAGGPDAGDELDSSPREENSQTSSVEKRRLPPTTSRALPTITQQPRRAAERKHAAQQSNERAGSAHDNTLSSEHREAQIDQADSPRHDAFLSVQPETANSASWALQADETTQPAIQSLPGPVDAPLPSPAAPAPKSRQDVQDELRKARLNGSLPRFGNPDPYGPGGSLSSPDR
jgi:hypothetical protein